MPLICSRACAWFASDSPFILFLILLQPTEGDVSPFLAIAEQLIQAQPPAGVFSSSPDLLLRFPYLWQRFLAAATPSSPPSLSLSYVAQALLERNLPMATAFLKYRAPADKPFDKARCLQLLEADQNGDVLRFIKANRIAGALPPLPSSASSPNLQTSPQLVPSSSSQPLVAG